MTINIPFSWSEYGYAAEHLVFQIRASGHLEHISCIYGIPRGGLVLAATLSRLLGLNTATDFSNRAQVGSFPLIVDDISDTGETFKNLTSIFHRDHFLAASIHLGSSSEFVPDFWVRLKHSPCWIVYPWEKYDEK